MPKAPNTIWTRSENGQNRNPNNSSRYHLESTKHNRKTIFWAARAHAQLTYQYQTICNSSTEIAPTSFQTLVVEYTSESIFFLLQCRTSTRHGRSTTGICIDCDQISLGAKPKTKTKTHTNKPNTTEKTNTHTKATHQARQTNQGNL